MTPDWLATEMSKRFCEVCRSEDAAGVETMDVTNPADPTTTITMKCCAFCAETTAGLPDIRSNEVSRKLNVLWRLLR